MSQRRLSGTMTGIQHKAKAASVSDKSPQRGYSVFKHSELHRMQRNFVSSCNYDRESVQVCPQILSNFPLNHPSRRRTFIIQNSDMSYCFISLKHKQIIWVRTAHLFWTS